MERKLYSVKEVSEMTGKTIKTINNLLSLHKDIERVKIGKSLKNWLPEESVEKIKEHSIENRIKAQIGRKLPNARHPHVKNVKNVNKAATLTTKPFGFRKNYSGYWKVSTFDESKGAFIVRHCSLTYPEARKWQKKFINEDKVCRITPH